MSYSIKSHSVAISFSAHVHVEEKNKIHEQLRKSHPKTLLQYLYSTGPLAVKAILIWPFSSPYLWIQPSPGCVARERARTWLILSARCALGDVTSLTLMRCAVLARGPLARCIAILLLLCVKQ